MKLKIGDAVIIKDPGWTYSGYQKKAIELGATKWKKEANPRRGDSGVIKNFVLQNKHKINRGFIYFILVDCGEKEYVVSESALEIMNDWDD